MLKYTQPLIWSDVCPERNSSPAVLNKQQAADRPQLDSSDGASVPGTLLDHMPRIKIHFRPNTWPRIFLLLSLPASNTSFFSHSLGFGRQPWAKDEPCVAGSVSVLAQLTTPSLLSLSTGPFPPWSRAAEICASGSNARWHPETSGPLKVTF